MPEDKTYNITRADNSAKQESAAFISIFINMHTGTFQIPFRYVREFYFIEDIYSLCITGKLVFIDEDGLIEAGPLIGNESLTVIYGDGEEDIERTFYIQKISDIEQLHPLNPTMRNLVQFFLVDPLFIPLTQRQYSRSWKEARTSDIIYDICSGMMGINKLYFDNWEETDEVLPYFYMPYWPPKTAIEWLLKRSSSLKHYTSGMLFYQSGKVLKDNDTPSTYNLASFETLMTQKELLKLSDEDQGIYVFEDTNKFLYNRILNFSISGIDDLARKHIRGGRRYGYDTEKKQIIDSGSLYNYKELVSKTTILGRQTLFDDISDPEISHVLTGESDPILMHNLMYDEWIKRYNNQQLLQIEVKGHENRYVGGIIDIIWPSTFREEIWNRNLEGPYLIKSITHHFTNSTLGYVQKMVLMKNGYQDSTHKDLIKSTKYNLMEETGFKKLMSGGTNSNE